MTKYEKAVCPNTFQVSPSLILFRMRQAKKQGKVPSLVTKGNQVLCWCKSWRVFISQTLVCVRNMSPLPVCSKPDPLSRHRWPAAIASTIWVVYLLGGPAREQEKIDLHVCVCVCARETRRLYATALDHFKRAAPWTGGGSSALGDKANLSWGDLLEQREPSIFAIASQVSARLSANKANIDANGLCCAIECYQYLVLAWEWWQWPMTHVA